MKTETFDKKQKEEHLTDLKIEEPKELYIYTKTTDDLILKSKAEMDMLIEKLKNTKYDKQLADFYSTYSHEFEDQTDL